MWRYQWTPQKKLHSTKSSEILKQFSFSEGNINYWCCYFTKHTCYPQNLLIWCLHLLVIQENCALAFVGLARSPLDYTFFFLPADHQGRHFVQWYAQEVKITHSHRNCTIVTQNGGSMPYRWKLGHVNLSYFWNCCSNTSGAPKVAALNPCLYLIDWGSWELICYLYMKYVCNLQGQM